jgi:hypothetical protein
VSLPEGLVVERQEGLERLLGGLLGVEGHVAPEPGLRRAQLEIRRPEVQLGLASQARASLGLIRSGGRFGYAGCLYLA